MGFDRIRIKENAKTHYQNNKWQNVLVVLISMLIGGGVSVVFQFTGKIPLVGIFMGLVSIAVSLLFTSIISMGTTTWFHRSIKTEGLKMEEMFWTFKEDYGGNVLLVFLIGLYTFLWSLLLFVPGIVKGYSYSLALYIKSENPNIKPDKAIDLSKKMTNGRKMDLFVLDLSYIGWFILSALTFNILGVLYVIPYYNAAKAFAYEEIKEEALSKMVVTEEEIYGY
ncbi:MAG: DUF975 family protein [Oscillospiraceae bacterium]